MKELLRQRHILMLHSGYPSVGSGSIRIGSDRTGLNCPVLFISFQTVNCPKITVWRANYILLSWGKKSDSKIINHKLLFS